MLRSYLARSETWRGWCGQLLMDKLVMGWPGSTRLSVPSQRGLFLSNKNKIAAQQGKSPLEFKNAIATEADYVGVLDIDRNMYDGLDYLPAKYFEYINDQYRLCVVTKHHDAIIGFAMMYIVDGGKPMVRQAGRVRADYQGQRISSSMNKYAQTLLGNKYNLERMLWSSDNQEASDIQVRRHGMSYMMERPLFSLDFSTQQLGLVMKSKEFSEVKEICQSYTTRIVNPSGFKDIMKYYPQDVTAMTPEGHWLIDWVPFRTLPSNWDLMMRDANVYVTMASGDGLLAVSFWKLTEVRVGLAYRADYFVHPKLVNDKELFVSHLMEHLTYINQFSKNVKVSFSLSLPQNAAKIGLMVKQLLATQIDIHCVNTPEKPCLVLENQLLPSKTPKL